MKKKTLTTLPFHLFSSLVIASVWIAPAFESAVAQEERKPAASKNKSKKSKTTVGDLLNEVSRRAKANGKFQIQKKKMNLPEFRAQKDTLRAPHAIGAIKPPPTIRLFQAENTDEGRLEKAVDSEIEELFKLTKRYRDSDNRGELWLRLGELYVEKAKLVKFRIQAAYDRKHQEWAERGRKGREPEINMKAGDIYHRKAIQLYDWFVHDFPKERRVDQALFFLCYNHFELDELKKGAESYDRLTSEFPNSPFVQETHFALGEYYFENEKWDTALKHYTEVLKNRRAATYSFAMYKIAWCNYRLGKMNVALKTLEDVIRLSRKSEETQRAGGLKQVNRLRLGNEAIRDLVPFYAEIGDYQKAKNYFQRIAGDAKATEMLEQLAFSYSDLGKKQASRYVFKDLIASNPTAPKAMDYQYNIVTNYTNVGDADIFKQELAIWIRDYGPESAWYESNSKNTELIAKSDKLREETLRNYVLQLHQTAQNSGSSYSQNLARDGYALYLKFFPDTARTAEMHFFFGELLFDMKDYEKAGIHYMWVADHGAKSRYYEEAVLNTVLALEKSLASETEIRKKIGDTTQPVPFTEVEERFSKAADRYVKAYPKSEKTVEIKFKLGRLHYTFNHFDDALKYFEDIVQNHPNSAQTVFAANLILDIYNLRKDYKGLSRVGKSFMSVPSLVKAGLDADVRNIVERSTFKQAQDMEVAKDYAGSAKSFDDFARAYPKSKLATSATFNAGVNYERSHNLPAAIAMYSLIMKSNDPAAQNLKPQARQLVARLYEHTGQFERSAKELEAMAKDNPKDPKVSDYYYNAAVIYDGMNNQNRAIANYNSYFESSKKASRVEALFKIAQIYERNGRHLTAVRYYEQYIDANPRDFDLLIKAHLQVALLNKKMGRISESEKWFQKTIAVQRALSRRKAEVGIPAAAEARFNLTQKSVTEFKALRIPANPQKQESVVREKLGLLNKLTKELAEIIKLDNGPYVVASLTTLGSAYEHMSDALYNAPAPKGLNAEEKKVYDVEVDRIASPLRQKAIENYRQALDKANQIDAYGEWVTQARVGLSRFDSKALYIPESRVFPAHVTDRMGI